MAVKVKVREPMINIVRRAGRQLSKEGKIYSLLKGLQRR